MSLNPPISWRLIFYLPEGRLGTLANRHRPSTVQGLCGCGNSARPQCLSRTVRRNAFPHDLLLMYLIPGTGTALQSGAMSLVAPVASSPSTRMESNALGTFSVRRAVAKVIFTFSPLEVRIVSVT